VVLRPTSRAGWLSKMAGVHLESAVMINRRNGISVVVGNRLVSPG
jgi:hypothetical protein